MCAHLGISQYEYYEDVDRYTFEKPNYFSHYDVSPALCETLLQKNGINKSIDTKRTESGKTCTHGVTIYNEKQNQFPTSYSDYDCIVEYIHIDKEQGKEKAYRFGTITIKNQKENGILEYLHYFYTLYSINKGTEGGSKELCEYYVKYYQLFDTINDMNITLFHPYSVSKTSIKFNDKLKYLVYGLNKEIFTIKEINIGKTGSSYQAYIDCMKFNP